MDLIAGFEPATGGSIAFDDSPIHGPALERIVIFQDIWMAETRNDAESAFDFFFQAYGAKYDKAVECLARNRNRLKDIAY